MDFFRKGLESAADFVWSAPMLALLVGCGVFLTLRLGFVQMKYLPQAFKFMLQNEKNAKGEVSSFGALCTSLSATVGTGNIVGVAAAVTLGGPGALFGCGLLLFSAWRLNLPNVPSPPSSAFSKRTAAFWAVLLCIWRWGWAENSALWRSFLLFSGREQGFWVSAP